LEKAIDQQKGDLSDVKAKMKTIGGIIKDCFTLIGAAAIAVDKVMGVIENLKRIGIIR